MMIQEVKKNWTVFYQTPGISPQYGVITSWTSLHVFVRFLGDEHSKACRPEDLYFPPDFCARDGASEPDQPYSNRYPFLWGL